MKRKNVFRLKQPNKPVQTFKGDDCIPESLKPEFDRLEAELEAFANRIENDPEIKAGFDRLEEQLKEMELKL